MANTSLIKIRTVAVNNTCRCCLDNKNLLDVFKVKNKKWQLKYSDMLRECLAGNDFSDNELPPWICIKCSSKINAFYNFKQRCLKNYAYLVNSKMCEALNTCIKKEKLEEEDDYISDNIIEYVQEVNIEKMNRNIKLEIFEENDKEREQEAVQFIQQENKQNVVENKGPKQVFKTGDQKIIKVVNKCPPSMLSNSETIRRDLRKRVPKFSDFILKDGKYQCLHCPAIYTRKNKLAEHVQMNRCQTYKKKDRVQQELVKGFKKSELPVLPEKIRVCPVCNITKSSHKKLVTHYNYVHLGIKYYCEICKKHYTSENRHKFDRHLNCEQCSELFTTKKDLDTHIISIHGKQPKKRHNCHCGKAYSSKRDYELHKKLVHNEMDYICHYCSKSFMRNDKLLQHVKIHTSKKVECEVCHKNISCLTYDKHLKYHKNPYVCYCDHCGRKFMAKYLLAAHITLHDPSHRPFSCSVCGQAFRRSDTKNKHQKYVHGM